MGFIADTASGQIGMKLGGAFGSLIRSTRVTKNDLLAAFNAEGIDPSDQTSKQAVVRTGMNAADDNQAQTLAERLVKLLEVEGLFSSDEARAQVDIELLKKTFEGIGVVLSDSGHLDWTDHQIKPAATIKPSIAAKAARATLDETVGGSVAVTSKESPIRPPTRTVNQGETPIDDVLALLARIPAAAHSLTNKRRKGRDLVKVTDEYDTQDFVFFALRLRYEGVVSEDPIAQTGGQGHTRGDFRMTSEKIMIEVKVAKTGHGVKEIKAEVAADQADYRDDNTVNDLIVVIYDLSNEIADKQALKSYLERGPKTSVAIVDWIRPHS